MDHARGSTQNELLPDADPERRRRRKRNRGFEGRNGRGRGNLRGSGCAGDPDGYGERREEGYGTAAFARNGVSLPGSVRTARAIVPDARRSGH